MNILYLTSHLDIGGVTSYILSLASGMKKRGHNVYVASGAGGVLPSFLENDIFYLPIPIKTKQELSPKVFISLYKLLKILKGKNIDIIHANTRVTQVLATLLNKFTGTRYISTCHGFFKRRLSRRIFPCWGLKVIAISEAVKDHLLEDFAIKEEDIRLIHNGIDIDKFKVQSPESKAKKKKELGLTNGPLVGIVGRLSSVKGHFYLIEAMKNVLEKITDAQLLIVGDGKIKQDLVNLSRRLGIDKSVYFISSVADTAQVLSAMDLFVMPSLKEGLGLSLMEAMASGLSVIASDVGGIKSLVQDGHRGKLVHPADSAAISGAILDLLADKDKARALGENARRFIRDNFSQDKMILETEKLYSDCRAL